MSKYIQLGKEIGMLVDRKQKAYGDSFGNSHKILTALYPNGVGLAQYQDMLTVVRIIDKLFRIANQKDAFGENPFQDIVGYGLLAVAKAKSKGTNFDEYLKWRLKENPELEKRFLEKRFMKEFNRLKKKASVSQRQRKRT